MTHEKTRTLYFHTFCDDEAGECQGFYEIVNKKLTFIDGWSMNDAHYRQEYMSGVFSHLGVEVNRLPEKHLKAATKMIRDNFGC